MRQTEHPQHRFRKSSRSMPTQGDCVEVSDLPGESALRDSRHRREGALRFPTGEWRAALSSIAARAAADTRLEDRPGHRRAPCRDRAPFGS